MTGFESGYDYFMKNSGAYIAAYEIAGKARKQADYVKTIEKEVDDFARRINKFKGSEKSVKQLKGDIAEFWAAGTFNINAAKAKSDNRAWADRSNGLGSVDVKTTWGEDYGLKYNGIAKETAKQQAKTYFERYKQSVSGKENPVSFSEYLKQNKIPEDENPFVSLYLGQKRLVPADQLEEIIKILDEKIATEQARRPELVSHLVETREMLCSKITDKEGVSSFELTEKEARRIADLAKKGIFDPVKEGLGLDPFIRFKFVMQNACQAGLSSMIITMALKTTPELYKAFVYLVKNGEISKENFSKVGLAAVSGAGEGFLHGALSAAILSCCEMGLLGSVKIVNPSITALIATLTLETIKDSFKVANGDISGQEMVNNFLRNMYVGSHSLALGIVSQYLIRIPILGYMIGSFLGSVIAGFSYQAGYSLTLSFCVYSGFTMFGLVKQDYTLPSDVLEQIGVNVFEYEKFSYEKFSFKEIQVKKVEKTAFSPKRVTNEYGITIKPLRRGVIGVGQIGYIW